MRLQHSDVFSGRSCGVAFRPRNKSAHHFQWASWFCDYIWLHKTGKHEATTRLASSRFVEFVLMKVCQEVSPKTENKVETWLKALCWTVQLCLCFLTVLCEWGEKRVKHNQNVISQMMQKTYYYYIKLPPKAYVNDLVLYKCIQKALWCPLFFE